MFWVGLAPAVLVFFVRRFVEEPRVSAETRAGLVAVGQSANFLDIFKRDILKTTLLACLLSIGTQGGYHAITFWLPKFLREERGLSVPTSGGYLAVIIAGSFIGYLVSAWLNDRIGRRINFILFAVFSLVVVIVYTLIPVNNDVIFFLGFPLGFLASGIFSGMGPLLTELFPTRMRGSGAGFAYNFGRSLAALNPWLVGLIHDNRLPLGASIGVIALFAYSLVAVAASLLPETKGKKLGPQTGDDAVT
jgi:fucose permease